MTITNSSYSNSLESIKSLLAPTKTGDQQAKSAENDSPPKQQSPSQSDKQPFSTLVQSDLQALQARRSDATISNMYRTGTQSKQMSFSATTSTNVFGPLAAKAGILDKLGSISLKLNFLMNQAGATNKPDSTSDMNTTDSTDPAVEPKNSINGTDHPDKLIGTNGDDRISGGSGNDTLVGGQGKDTFAFNPNNPAEGDDVIKDFEIGKDTIELKLSDIVASTPDGGDGFQVSDLDAPGSGWEIGATDNGDVMVTHPGGTITLEGVKLDALVGMGITDFQGLIDAGAVQAV